MTSYFAVPFDRSGSPERAPVTSEIVRGMFEHRALFTDYQPACDDRCGECPRCAKRLATVIKALSDPDSRVWEVWNGKGVDEEVKLIGVVYLTNLVEGCDATAHYLFFDGKLADKTELLESMIQNVFDDGLHRLTVEVPEHAHALARHASRKLGFHEEGRKREAIRYNGHWEDVIVLGRTNGSTRVDTTEEVED